MRALVTGGASGIGRAVAQALVHEGVETVIVGRRESTLGIAHDIGAIGLVGDVTVDPADIIRRAGPLTFLINNAGHSLHQPVGRFRAADFAALHAVHVTAPALLSQAFAAQQPAHKNTRAIVNVSPTLAQQSVIGTAAYAAAKAGQIALTRILAAELAPLIRVNAILPGVVQTAMTESHDLEYLERIHPLGLGQPEQVAAAVLYLLRSSWLTGVALPVDGGLLLGATQA